ncbi:hypothetical protein BDFB_007536 [Asbolus verrucosus]|uniref:Phage integrase domain containing protein n=1 Tax=Asbolus verrucosus TaxID=1661398 RepID=A0A482V8J3_ASBVE|nr:hypothetical protein BDFB_007536 [Asbolus verrucosus]
MLKCTLNVHHNVTIENYPKLRPFLKRQSNGYKAKKATVFTPDQIREFINEAPDDKFLATKVALIMGVMGCCRANEFYLMYLHDQNTAFLIGVPKTKSKVKHQFSIAASFYDIRS